MNPDPTARVDGLDWAALRGEVDAAGSAQTTPLPDLVAALRTAFYPHLLPTARKWADRLGRPAPWQRRVTLPSRRGRARRWRRPAPARR